MLFRTESDKGTGAKMQRSKCHFAGFPIRGVEGTYSPTFGGTIESVNEMRQSLGSQGPSLRRKQVMASRQEEMLYFGMGDYWNFKSQMRLENIIEVL